MTGIDYAQQDPRWKDLMLGGSHKETIGMFGCLLVALTEVATALGHNLTPDQMNDQLKQHNCYAGPEADDVARNDALSVIFPDIQYIERKDWRTAPADMAYFNVGSDISSEIIICLDNHPERAGLQQHWCRVIGLTDDKQDVVIVDSWDGRRKKLAETYGGGKSAAQIIYTALKYHKPMVAQAQVPVAPKSVVMQQGGTLWQIALDHHVSVAAIQDINRGRIPDDPRKIPIGATILIP